MTSQSRALPMVPSPLPGYPAMIVGAGVGGIGAGVALRRTGIENFVLVDKYPKVGGPGWPTPISL